VNLLGGRCITKFGVADEYEETIFKGKPFLKIKEGLIEEEDIKNYRIYPIISEHIKYYPPALTDSIHTYLAKVTDVKSLKRFVERYGLLGLWDKEDTSVAYSGNNPIEKILYLDNIEDSLMEARKVRMILSIYNSKEISRGRRPSILESLIKAYPDHKEVFEKADDKTLKTAYAAWYISGQMGGIHQTISFDEKGKPFPCFAYLALIDAIWHSLFQVVVQQEQFKECPECHSLHTGPRKFCPKPPYYKRSPCQNKYSQRVTNKDIKPKEEK